MVLQTMAQNRCSAPGGLALDSLLARQLALLPYLGSRRILDFQWAQHAGGACREQGRTAPDADGAFEQLRDALRVGLFVGAPVHDRARRLGLRGVARRLEDAQGCFTGIVQAHVPVAHFQQ